MKIIIKQVLYFFFLFIYYINALAQSNLHVLEQKLSKVNSDTAKVNILNKIAFELSATDAEKSYTFLEEANKISEKINYQKGLADAAHIQGNLFLYQNNNQSALEYYFKALKIREKISDLKGIASTCTNIGTIYQNEHDVELALQYLHRSLNISRKINDKKGMAYTYYSIGSIYDDEGDFNKAILFYCKSIILAIEIHDNVILIYCYNTLGIIFDKQGDLEKALEYYQKSRLLNEQIDDKNALAFVYNNIAIILIRMDDRKNALVYYEKALKIKEQTDDKKGIADSYNNIGLIYSKFGEIDSTQFKIALDYFEKALVLYEEIKGRFGKAKVYGDIAHIYKSKRKYKKALEYYQKSLTIAEEIGSSKLLAVIYSGIGYCYMELYQYEIAENYLKRGVSLSKEIGMPELIVISTNALSIVQAQKHDYKNAYENLYLYQQMQDSTANDENTRKITQLTMQYEFDKQQRQQEFEQKQKDQKNLEESKRKTLFLNFFILGFLLMVALAVVIFRSYRQKQRDNILLIAQKSEILEQKNQIEEKNAMLEQLNEEIRAQRDEIEKHRDMVMEQKEKITDSIVYSKRIQSALLPPLETVSPMFKDFFLLYLPKDIVSGDFYWFNQRANYKVIVCADCTGHGVPGALMSMLGVSFLNEIVSLLDVRTEMKASIILNRLREMVKKALRQTGKENEAADGMDISLVVFNTETNKISFSGAYNPLVIIRKKTSTENAFKEQTTKMMVGKSDENQEDYELLQIDADKMPIGIYMKEKSSFTEQIIQIQEDDIVYLSTDGFMDQYSSSHEGKYLFKRFKSTILRLQGKTLAEQKQILHKEHNKWKGYDEQMDDICMIAIKLI